MSELASIIIPVFNQVDFTRQCLESLYRCTLPGSFEIIVVDNGSTDETPIFLHEAKSRYQGLRVLQLSKNHGYSEANNRGAEIAAGSRLIFLNNDTELLPGWLEPLVAALTDPAVGIAGSRLIYPDTNRINHAGYVYNQELMRFYLLYENESPDFWGVEKEREFQALLGACIVMSKSLFQEVGGFGDLGLEDIDLCFKVRAAGRRAVYVPQSTLYHHGSITLRLSAPGTLPEMNTQRFNATWGPQNIKADDVLFYQEDGITYLGVRAGVPCYRAERGFKVYLDEAAACKMQGEDGRAIEILEAHKSHRDIFIELALLYSEAGKGNKALETFEEVTARFPDCFEGYLEGATLALAIGERTRAEKLCHKLLSRGDYISSVMRRRAEQLLRRE